MSASAAAPMPAPRWLLTACYLYTIDTYGYPPTIDDGIEALADLRALGFRYVELEGVGDEHIRAVHAAAGWSRIPAGCRTSAPTRR